MLRRLVLVRRHEPLEMAWTERSFGPAEPFTSRLLTGVSATLNTKYHPVKVQGPASYSIEQPRAEGFNYTMLRKGSKEPTFALVANFDSEKDVEKLRAEQKDNVIGVFADPHIAIFPSPYCDTEAVGNSGKVAKELGVNYLKKTHLTGQGVRIAVMDTGIDAKTIPVSGGWAPPGVDYTPGTFERDHGTMVAFDASISAPKAAILDYALLQTKEETWTGFLSDAVAAYADLLQRLEREPGPLVVNNSWGMYNRSEDSPIGSPDNYSANPDHPFNQIVGSLVEAGADIFFAAGNCGIPCPDNRCGVEDTGPGASIHGANSHPDVVTVAAVTVTGRRLGYSSQGPGALYHRKPDIAAYSHFDGSHVFPEPDGGTSAASPVAAGVVAAVRERYSNSKIPPASMKGLVQRTARDLGGKGWDYDFGYGVIDAKALAKTLKKS